MLNDFRYAFRSLVRQPTFAVVAVLTLVLGIGTNTAIFSVIKAVLLNQLPYDDPSRLVVLTERNPEGNADLVAPLTFGDWQAASKTVPAMAAYRQLRYAFAGAGDPLDVPSVRATPNVFPLLRVNPILGRTFIQAEGVTGFTMWNPDQSSANAFGPSPSCAARSSRKASLALPSEKSRKARSGTRSA